VSKASLPGAPPEASLEAQLGETLPGEAGSLDITNPGQVPTLDGMAAVEIADLLLLALAWQPASALTVAADPAGPGRAALRLEHGGRAQVLATVDPALADAVVARLAIIAELDLSQRADQVGRLAFRPVRSGTSDPVEPTHLLVVIRSTPLGLVGELHRVGPVAASAAQGLAAHELSTDADGAVRIGPYLLGPVLGRGGTATVYRAVHTVLDKAVALKLLPGDVYADPDRAARFLLEARAACRTRHPGIVDVTDAGRLADGRLFLVMELIEGPTLATVLQGGPFAEGRAVQVALQIALALEAAHRGGVVHRDLKPANIFLDEGDRVKIGDFGVAKVLEPARSAPGATPRTRSAGLIVGTAHYMSPEQARGEPVDARADLYALGCLMFEMLTGHVPFDAKTWMLVLIAQMTHTPPPLVGPDGAIPEAIARVVQRAMAKRPEERYQSASELVADLTRLSRHEGWRRWLP
jgi:serine/threonine-protein kinase